MYGNLKEVVREEFGIEGEVRLLVSHSFLRRFVLSSSSEGSLQLTTVLFSPYQLPKVTKSSEDASKTLRPSLHSFKVLTECPIAVVLVFQTWKTIVFPYIKDYFPLVMEVSTSRFSVSLRVSSSPSPFRPHLLFQCLTLQAEPQRRAYLAAAQKGELFVGVSDGIKNRDLYTELIVAQVKVSLYFNDLPSISTRPDFSHPFFSSDDVLPRLRSPNSNG